MKKSSTKFIHQDGIKILVRLAHFRREVRKLEPVTYPVWLKRAALKQGITIKD